MNPDTIALFRKLADRSPSERQHYYLQRQIPDELRADVESLLQFDRPSSDGLTQQIGDAAQDALLKHDGYAEHYQSAIQSEDQVVFRGTARFALRRQLGAGAFGTVYEVWDREQQATVAVKVLHRSKPDLLFRFKREFRAVIDVRHRNLVRLYELLSDGDCWFFSMELVDGESFLEYVRPGGHCNLQRLRAALSQLTAGIQALHAAGRLHRDLKPANAMVTPAGRVVILDFSLVHEADPLIPNTSRTLVAGTPAYIAPEQILDGHVSEAADWYAVGVMLFQALTGVLPHT